MPETERKLDEIQTENDMIIMNVFSLDYEKYFSQNHQDEV
jgi:hypothetical protein